MVSRLNLPPEVLHDLQKHLREADALRLAAAPLSHRRYLQALHRDTHFRVDGKIDNCRTTIGSRPGDTFADIVSGYLWSRVLKVIEHELDQANLLERVPTFDGAGPRAQRTGESAPLLGPTWCDDLCICISAMTSAELERKSGVICGVLLDTCIGFGMLPNLAKGKTEIMLCFRGCGSRGLRVKYYSPEQGGQMLVCGEYGQHRINVVGEYKHLGGVLHHGGKLNKEIRKRLAVAHQAFNEHRALLFQNPRFSQTKRVELFRSLVLSGLLYGTESWVQGSRSDDLHLHGAILRLYKRLLKCAHDSHVTDRAVCTQLGLPTPTVLLRTSRLRYLGQLYSSIPQDIWNVILQDQEWIAVLEGDIQWMWSQLKHSSDLWRLATLGIYPDTPRRILEAPCQTSCRPPRVAGDHSNWCMIATPACSATYAHRVISPWIHNNQMNMNLQLLAAWHVRLGLEAKQVRVHTCSEYMDILPKQDRFSKAQHAPCVCVNTTLLTSCKHTFDTSALAGKLSSRMVPIIPRSQERGPSYTWTMSEPTTIFCRYNPQAARNCRYRMVETGNISMPNYIYDLQRRYWIGKDRTTPRLWPWRIWFVIYLQRTLPHGLRGELRYDGVQGVDEAGLSRLRRDGLRYTLQTTTYWRMAGLPSEAASGSRDPRRTR